jgi:hypothetical protein
MFSFSLTQTSLKMIFIIWSSSPLFIMDLIKIGHLVGLGSKVQRFTVQRFNGSEVDRLMMPAW